MWMLLAIALPMLAGGALAAWRPKDRTARQNFVVGSACLTAACALAAVFTLRGEDPLVLLVYVKLHINKVMFSHML